MKTLKIKMKNVSRCKITMFIAVTIGLYTGVLTSPQPDLLPDVFCLMVRIFRLMLVLLYIFINSINILPIMIINRTYETQNLLSLQLVYFLIGLRTHKHRCKQFEQRERPRICGPAVVRGQPAEKHRSEEQFSTSIQCSDCSFLCKQRKWRTKEFSYMKSKICCMQQVMCCLMTCQIMWTEQILSQVQQWHTSHSGLAVSLYCILIVAAEQ